MGRLENLRPFTSKTARKNQQKSVEARKEKIQRDKAYKMFARYLLNKKTVTKKDIEELAGDDGEFKENKKTTRVLLDLAKMRKKAIETSNVRGYVELLKTVGFHFDQGKEALGAEDNPISVQATAIAPKQVKEISEALEDNC